MSGPATAQPADGAAGAAGRGERCSPGRRRRRARGRARCARQFMPWWRAPPCVPVAEHRHDLQLVTCQGNGVSMRDWHSIHGVQNALWVPSNAQALASPPEPRPSGCVVRPAHVPRAPVPRTAPHILDRRRGRPGQARRGGRRRGRAARHAARAAGALARGAVAGGRAPGRRRGTRRALPGARRGGHRRARAGGRGRRRARGAPGPVALFTRPYPKPSHRLVVHAPARCRMAGAVT
jgi:hypothetical protein